MFFWQNQRTQQTLTIPQWMPHFYRNISRATIFPGQIQVHGMISVIAITFMALVLFITTAKQEKGSDARQLDLSYSTYGQWNDIESSNDDESSLTRSHKACTFFVTKWESTQSYSDNSEMEQIPRLGICVCMFRTIRITLNFIRRFEKT